MVANTPVVGRTSVNVPHHPIHSNHLDNRSVNTATTTPLPPSTRVQEEYDDNDDNEEQDYPTAVHNDAEAAAAAAEAAAMERNARSHYQDAVMVGQQARMGVAEGDDGVEGFALADENATLVQQRLVQFLGT
jgi:hypothetical protein